MVPEGASAEIHRDRERLLADAGLTGRAFVARYTALVDEWVAGLFAAAAAAGGRAGATALVAIGGYGRGELCPGSDLDLLLLHDGGDLDAVTALAEQLWYPIWDAGLHLGHAVRTTAEALGLAREDLDTATALLDVRLLAGDADLAQEAAADALAQWQGGGDAQLARLGASVRARHAASGEVAFLLEPDLKSGRGGLRDVHALGWAERLGFEPLAGGRDVLAGAYDTLLGVRVELHRRNGGRGEALHLQEQDAVAAALAYRDADDLLAAVAGAARRIAWRSDDAWEQFDRRAMGPSRRSWRRKGRQDESPEPQELAPGVVLAEGRVDLAPEASLSAHPELVLDAAAAAAERGLRLAGAALRRCAAELPTLPTVWPTALREAFVRLLLAGSGSVAVIEDLDQHGLWVALVPEWAAVRNRPQRNAYHRFTVDRHLVETSAEAAGLADRVDRPDLLVLGALLHDLGKGASGDHSEAGAAPAERVLVRLGYPAADVAQVVTMVRHHLLLPEVATRRDLSEPATVARVTDAVGDVATLRLLAELAEADGLATGPSAWSSWKAGLVRELVERADASLRGETGDGHAAANHFPTAEERALLDAQEACLRTEGDTLVLVAPDRPGLFSRVAGALSLHGLQVSEARALSDDAGWVLDRFRVAAVGRGASRELRPEDRWDEVRADIERVLAGRLALHARLAERARAYAHTRHESGVARGRVVIDNDASALSTVVEVHAQDSVGLLYRITRAMAELNLDLRSARVETLGDRVVDVFYVRDVAGAKLADADHLAEIERALLFAIDQS